MKIKAVIFDLGQVIANSEWPLVNDKIAEEIKQPSEIVQKTMESLFDQWCLGQLKEKDLWKEFERRTNSSIPREFTNDFFLKTYKAWSKDIDGTWDIIKELQARGIRLALLSNTVSAHVKANEEMGRFQRLRDLGFEAFVFSFEEGCMKPDLKIYEVALTKLKLPAENCVFVDDRIKMIDGAEKIGMKGIHFISPEKLREDLNKIGLL